jgi:hypothetical protein
MSDPKLHISVDVPAGATKAERRDMIAAAVEAGIRHVATSPDFRLAMILGEAWIRFEEIVSWVAGEIEKDEKKAPGLKLFISECRVMPTPPMSVIKMALLALAHGRLRTIGPDLKQIECQKITAPAIPGTD